MKPMPKNYRRVKILWRLFAPALFLVFSKKFGFRSKKYHPVEEPFLILSNHTDWPDPGYILGGVKGYYRIVSGDHVVENPLARFAFHFFARPIINYRQNSSDVVYNNMLETLKRGINVIVMAEARVTDTGRTAHISPRNATLIKEAGCGFITHRITGGYLTRPRWADKRRKGPVNGEVVHHYTKAEVEKMTEEEIYEAICRDLYYDAYEVNRLMRHRYVTKNPAQSAEYVLYGCPKCGSVGKLHTKHDRIFCDCCDFEATVDDFGFWHSDDMEFDTIPAWDDYQKELIYKLIDDADDPNEVLVEHDEQQVYTMDESGSLHLADKHGIIRLYKDSVELVYNGMTTRIPGKDIKNISYSSKSTVGIVTKDTNYRVKTKKPRAANIYVVAVRYMKGRKSL